MGFLKALEPKYSVLGDVERLSQAGLSEEFVNSIMDNYRFWQDNLEDVCRRAQRHPGRAGDEAGRGRASTRTASLTEAIHLMVVWQTQSLLVTRGAKVVGILRLSDLFAEVAGFVTSGRVPLRPELEPWRRPKCPSC